MKTINVRYSYGDKAGAQTHITLESGQVASTTEARGLAIECLRGSLWITFENGGVDHVLEPGERIAVKGGGRMVIEAMAASELVFYRQQAATEPALSLTRPEAACSPECWRTFVTGVALPRANFDSAF